MDSNRVTLPVHRQISTPTRTCSPRIVPRLSRAPRARSKTWSRGDRLTKKKDCSRCHSNRARIEAAKARWCSSRLTMCKFKRMTLSLRTIMESPPLIERHPPWNNRPNWVNLRLALTTWLALRPVRSSRALKPARTCICRARCSVRRAWTNTCLKLVANCKGLAVWRISLRPTSCFSRCPRPPQMAWFAQLILSTTGFRMLATSYLRLRSRSQRPFFPKLARPWWQTSRRWKKTSCGTSSSLLWIVSRIIATKRPILEFVSVAQFIRIPNLYQNSIILLSIIKHQYPLYWVMTNIIWLCFLLSMTAK